MRPLNETSIRALWSQYLRHRKRTVVGIHTGLRRLDEFLCGLGNSVSIQGKTGVCKSTLAWQIVIHNVMQKGYPALVVDKENGEGRCIERLVCAVNNVSSTLAKTCDDIQLKSLEAAVTSLPIHLHSESVATRDVLKTRLYELKEQYPKKPLLLLIDSFQALDRIEPDEYNNLTSWAYWLDALKLEFKGRLTIIMVSEKNMAGYDNNDDASGAKGTNAAVYKPETIFNIFEDQTGTICLKVAKNRDGPSRGIFKLEKRLANPANPRSFTFVLQEVEELDV